MAEKQGVAKVAELLDGARFANVTSLSAEGRLVSRPLTVQQTEFDGDLWFFVDEKADLLDQVAADARVNCALQHDSVWVSIAGRAAVVEDPAKAKELWNETTAAWFAAEGSQSSSADHPGPEELGAVLVKIEGDTAEYWESDGKVKTIASLVKARVTGESQSAGQNEVVDLP